ncbi:18033_t:CDS:2 [Dentiscutata erythropus]|uniref:18033_t:CDS:1 n=1 Tax=Dentiscutata erythropus TaxID=1348616 RepID=A0A9N9GSX5_9GLOM|nr:18033_t:CDS:2 [Dentiscutata erythropus]
MEVPSEIADETTSKATNETSISSRHMSAVWKHFTLLTDEQKAKCEYCNRLFSHKKECGTSYLWCHLDISNMIVWDELSFQFVEDIIKAYDKRKTLIKETLQNAEGKISLTCDAWTSLQQLGYLSVTAYYLDKGWNLVFILLSFPLIPYPHTGVNITNCIKTEIDEWFITTKLQTITLDNATSNDVAICELANCISQDSFININEDLFHNCCFTHILNLIVKDGLKKILDVIGKVRNCIKAIHTAPRRCQIFLNICESESVKSIIPLLDCDTR